MSLTASALRVMKRMGWKCGTEQVARVPKLIQLEIRYECFKRSMEDFWKEVGRRQG